MKIIERGPKKTRVAVRSLVVDVDSAILSDPKALESTTNFLEGLAKHLEVNTLLGV